MMDKAMRIAVGQFHELTDEKLRFAAQIGVSGIQMNNPTLPGDSFWEEADIRSRTSRPISTTRPCSACRAATSRSRTTAARS